MTPVDLHHDKSDGEEYEYGMVVRTAFLEYMVETCMRSTGCYMSPALLATSSVLRSARTLDGDC